jgi:hypothetical protein
MGERREWLRQAQTVAMGCGRLPESFHGKEGVDGSSPSEGFEVFPGQRGVSFADRATDGVSNVHAASTAWTSTESAPVNVSSSLIACSRPLAVEAVDHHQARPM